MVTRLFLCALEHIGDLTYGFSRINGKRSLILARNGLYIKSLKFEASIFSPPVLKVTCPANHYPKNGIVAYYTTYSVILLEQPKSPYVCLFTNTDELIPFVVTNVSYPDSKTVFITLMEKRALSLALTHSFACIGQESIGAGEEEDGLLSIAKIVEELSNIPEEEKERIFRVPGLKYIFNFNAYGFENDLIKRSSDKLFSCAFLSRFIVSSRQSRLEAITSLMFKFGYGFAYRPLERQYYAIDLLSNSAPGFNCDRSIHFVNGEENIRFYFDDAYQSKDYFKTYAKNYYRNNPDDCHRLQEFENKKEEYKYKSDEYDYFSHNFADFYCTRLFNYSFKTDCIAHYLSTSGTREYCCLSRCSPFICISNFLTEENLGIDYFGFDITLFSGIAFRDLIKKITVHNNMIANDVDNNFLSNVISCFVYDQDRNIYSEGARRIFFEDQVELDGLSILVRENKIYTPTKESIKTVNHRLAYAKYKLDYMKQNCFTQKFQFKKGVGLSSSFNLVYEIFNWLGFHTDIFMKLSRSSKLDVKKKKHPSPSGATHSIDATKTPDFWKNDENLTDFIQKFSDYIPLLPQYSDKWALFGKFSISIEENNVKMDDDSYCITSALTFYFDITDYNTGFLFQPYEEDNLVIEMVRPIEKDEIDSDSSANEDKKNVTPDISISDENIRDEFLQKSHPILHSQISSVKKANSIKSNKQTVSNNDIDNLSNLMLSENVDNDNKGNEDMISSIISDIKNLRIMDKSRQNVESSNISIFHRTLSAVTDEDASKANKPLEREILLDGSRNERLNKAFLSESKMEFCDEMGFYDKNLRYIYDDYETALKIFVADKMQSRLNDNNRRKAQREGLSRYEKVKIRFQLLDDDIIQDEINRMTDKDKEYVNELKKEFKMNNVEKVDK